MMTLYPRNKIFSMLNTFPKNGLERIIADYSYCFHITNTKQVSEWNELTFLLKSSSTLKYKNDRIQSLSDATCENINQKR